MTKRDTPEPAAKPALQYVPASAEPPSGEEFWQQNAVPDGWGTQPVSPEAKEISSSYGLTERQAQNIVDFIDLVRAFDGDGGSNLLFDDTFGKLDDRQMKAVYVFALHLKLGTVSPLFFKQMADALESPQEDECQPCTSI